MKTYKINGKEIERINGGVIDFNGFKAENLTSTEMKINELLEALSDKEESKQPISLGVEIERIVRLHTHEDRVDEADIAEDVLSLIHSHLIKEIQLITNLNGEIEHEDIIKIINNIK